MMLILNIFADIGAELVNAYARYSGFIHSIFPDQIGDLVEYIVDIGIIVIFVKIISSYAFTTKGNG